MRIPNSLVIVGGLAAALVPPTALAATVSISSWGFVVTQSNTTYELTADLVEPAGTQGTDGTMAILVLPSVHDIVIDGQGFRIDGRDTAGSPDRDTGIRLLGIASGPVRNVHIQAVRFTDVHSAIVATDDLCNVLIENCEFGGCDGDAQIAFTTTLPDAAMSWITVRDNWFHDSRGIPVHFLNAASAVGLQAASMSHIAVVNNVIHDNRRASTGPAAWNAAIAFRHGADHVRVWDNVVLNGDDLSGLFIGSDDAPEDTYDQVSIRGNHFGGNRGSVQVPAGTTASGITIDRVTTATGDFSTWEVTRNYLYLNELAGIEAIAGASSPPSLPADGNWWGEDGTVGGTFGNGALGATDAAPLDLADGILALPDAAGIDRALADTDGYLTQVVLLNQNDGAPGIRGFDVDYDFAPHLGFVRGVEGPFLRRQAPLTQFFDLPRIGGVGNERTASGAILGGSTGAVGNGALCFTVFRAGAEELGPGDDFFLDEVLLRDPDNFPLNVVATDDADRRVDDTPPVVLLAPPGGNPCVAADEADVSVLISDGFALEDVFYRAYKADKDPGCWLPLALDEPGTVYTGPDPVTIDLTCCEGEFIFEICATDDAGNLLLDRLDLVHDSTPPADFAGSLTAVHTTGHGTPGLEEVEVSWSGAFEAGADLRLRYLPYGGAAGFFAYPEYDDEPGVNPHFPAAGEGTEIDVPDVGVGNVVVPFTIAERSFYSFTLFVVDCAGNTSPGTAPDTRATVLSYTLGDWDSNLPPICPGSPEFTGGSGTVDICDVISFSLAFATTEGHPDYHPEADIGPTTPGPGPLDLPVTDNQIDFEDLILLAITFGSVTPFTGDAVLAPATGTPPAAAVLAAAGTDDAQTIRLELGEPRVTGERVIVPLLLRGNRRSVKGLEAIIEHGPPAAEFVEARPNSGLGDGVFFVAVPGHGGVISLNLAVLGRDRVLEGSGMVAELEFRLGAESSPTALPVSPALRITGEKLRDARNHELRGTLSTPLARRPGAAAAGTQAAPAAAPGLPELVLGFGQPEPNPFNPSTRLPFTLPAPELVTIRIFDAGGRLTRELWNGLTAAGHHQVVWDGRTQSGAAVRSGLYLAEMHAGRFRAVRKLVVVR